MDDKFSNSGLNQNQNKNKNQEQKQNKNTKDCGNKVRNKDINKSNNSWS